MGKRQSESRRASGVQWRRVNRRALRIAAFSFLLPVPVAMAAPQATVSTEQLVAMSQMPVTGVGDTVLPHVLPLDDTKPGEKNDLSASLTRVAKSKKAPLPSPSDLADNGIPVAALRAYRTAEATMAIADPSCRLSWGLLAGIGRIESDHGRYAGAVLGKDGVSSPEILGVPLNGTGAVSAIADTDNGQLDGDRRWDRAIGSMQFIPSTWAMVGVDGDGNGNRNPHDIDDAALAAAVYLCVGDNDLSTPQGVNDALFSYNHSQEYVALVAGVANAYERGVVDLPQLATLQLPGGPGAAVDLRPGAGIAIGASDEVSDAEKKAVDRQRDRQADDRKTGGGGEKADPTQPKRGGNDTTDDNTTGSGEKKGDRPTDQDEPQKRDRDKPAPVPTTKPSPEPTTRPSPEPTTKPSPKPTTKPSPTTPEKTEQPEDTEQPEEPEEEEPVVTHTYGVLVFCDDSESTLCLQGAEDQPLDLTEEAIADYVEAEIVGLDVTVIHHSDDQGEVYIFDIEEGTLPEPE